MKAKTLARFMDLKNEIIREVGDEFELSKERFKEIKKRGNLIEEVVKSDKIPEVEDIEDAEDIEEPEEAPEPVEEKEPEPEEKPEKTKKGKGKA